MTKKRVLITGFTSQQANPVSHHRSKNFAGLLHDTLAELEDVEVEWRDVPPDETIKSLDSFDTIYVGLASPLALGATRSYGALGIIDKFWASGKLRFYIDTPDVWSITRGVRSVINKPESILKDLFSNRLGYEHMTMDHRYGNAVDGLVGACRKLNEGDWPNTLVPVLPWSSLGAVEEKLPDGARGKTYSVSFDRRIFDSALTPEPSEKKLAWWSFDKIGTRTESEKWINSLTLEKTVVNLPKNHRIETDSKAYAQLQQSIGLLVPPVNKSGFWTPSVAKALVSSTPVFTDYHFSRKLGAAWDVLPRTFEQYTRKYQLEVIEAQSIAYEDWLPEREELGVAMSRFTFS